MRTILTRVTRWLAVAVMGLGLNVGLLANDASATTTYFCNGGGGSGNCVQLAAHLGSVTLKNHANASPALHETFSGTMCGNNRVHANPNGCPFSGTAAPLNNTYENDFIVEIKFTNYNNQCASAGGGAGTVIGDDCGANYTAWVRDGTYYLNIRVNNEDYTGTPWLLTGQGTNNAVIVDDGSNSTESQTWDNHQY